MNYFEPIMLGEYNVKDTNNPEGRKACFCFEEGNVLFVFDFNLSVSEKIHELYGKRTNFREIVLAFSINQKDLAELKILGHCGIDYHVISFRNIIKDKDVIIRSIWIDHYNSLQVKLWRGYDYFDISGKPDATYVPTNVSDILVEPISSKAFRQQIAYSVWRSSNTLSCLFYYNGYSGGIDESVLRFLLSHKNVTLMYYISSEIYKDTSAGKMFKIIKDIFDDIDNPIKVLGYRSYEEKIYIKGRIRQ